MSNDSRFFGDPREALATLASYGCVYDGMLDVEEEVDGIGKLKRFFGVFPNVCTMDPPENPAIYKRMLRLLDDPDNRKIAAKLRDGGLTYTPFNKKAADQVSKELDRVHLPWAFSIRNLPMMLAFLELHESDPLPFNVVYSRLIDVDGAGKIKLRKLFSQTIDEVTQGTWMQPIYEEMLDEDVALVLEATVLLEA